MQKSLLCEYEKLRCGDLEWGEDIGKGLGVLIVQACASAELE